MIRYPDESVLPILELRGDGTPEDVLGTGFVLAPKGIIVTARHVLAGRPADGNSLVVAIEAYDESVLEFRQIRRVALSSNADVAIAELGSVDGLRMLNLNRGEVATNVDVIAVDHSSTHVITNERGIRTVRFSPGTLKGNIVRHYISDFGAHRGMRCFDTSFPALRGASGSPVLVQPGFAVAGMLVANVERHLLPAHILTVQEGDSTIEEVRYYLPFGRALEADEVVAALQDLGVPSDAS